MNNNQNKGDISDRFLKYLLICLAFLLLLYLGSALFIPLSYALLIALILYPVCNWLEKRKIPRSLAILVSLLLVTLFLTGIVMLFIWQINYLKDEIPRLTVKLHAAVIQFQHWFNGSIGAPLGLKEDWLKSSVNESGSFVNTFISATVKGVANSLFSLFIIPVFAALFLYHRNQFVLFLKSLVKESMHEKLHSILHQTSYTYYRYIIGLLKVYIIVGILNSIGLIALGIEHAVMFGMLTAFMTMIPYVGIIISSLLPITVAWITKDSVLYPLGVVAVFTFVQYLENSVIFPKVVGKQLNVSTWAILVALIAGGIIWGISGMILFMPFIAILKILSDDNEELKALNILIGRKEN